MRSLLIVLGLLISLPVLAQQVYRWVDEDGVTHYSDVPRSGAERVDLKPAQTFEAPEAYTSAPEEQTDSAAVVEEAEPGYETLEIASPQSEQTIWNTGGQLNVSLTLQPRLRAGHSVRLFLNGQLLEGLPTKSTSVQLSEVSRGEHNLRAEIHDRTGQKVIASPAVTFYVQQTTVNRRPGI